MVKKSKRINLLVGFVPMLMLLAGSVYVTFHYAKDYLKSSALSTRFEAVERLKSASRGMVNEISCVATTVGEESHVNEVCKDARVNSDQLLSTLNMEKIEDPLSKLLHTVMGDKQSQSIQENMQELSTLGERLKKIRYDIDTRKNIDIDMLINGDYYIKVVNPIYNTIKMLELIPGETNKGALLRNLQEMTDIHYYADLETILVMYYIASDAPIVSDILKQWDTSISSSLLPSDQKFGSEEALLQDNLKRIFEEKVLNDAVEEIENIRIELISNHTVGGYAYTRKEWTRFMSIKSVALSKATALVMTKLSSEVNRELNESKQLLLAGAALVLLSIIFNLFLLRYYFKVKEEDVVLEGVVEGIEKLSLDTNNENLPAMPSNLSNKKEIYSYLESILQLLHKKELEAAEANKAKGHFLANMSHEIRTPLNGIVGFTELLRETPLNEDQREFTSIIQSSSENLLSIINDILDISKINEEKMDLEEISFDLFEKVESTVEMFSTRVDQKDIELGVFIEPTLNKVWMGDPTKISQVLTNLIGNAAKFTPTYGKISVHVESIQLDDIYSRITFSVKDSGIGIDEEAQTKIFEAFSQADTGTTREFGGTGLGLAISSKMVEIMGGKLNVESEKDEGSTFSFSLVLGKDTMHKSTPIIDFKSLKVGLALPTVSIDREIDQFLKAYVEALNAEFSTYYYDDLFGEKGSAVPLPDVMIFDHHYLRQEGWLTKIQTLPCEIALISTGNLKGRINPDIHHFSSIVFSPVTLGKTVKVLRNIGDDEKVNVVKKEKKSKQLIQLSNVEVLVAEDNVINQKLIKISLEKFDLNVTLASNGEEALQKRKEHEYALIFMDIQMPVMNGMEATSEILEYEKKSDLNHVPIVALTANTLAGDREKYIAAGMDGYLSKPIQFDKLEEIVEKYLKDTSKETELKEASFEENIIEESVVEESVVEESVVEEKSIEKISELREEVLKDTLLCVSNSLLERLYLSMLKRAGHKVDSINDPNKLLDILESVRYKYVLYEAEAFGEQKRLMCDVIKDAGSKPVILVSQKRSELSDKCLECNVWASDTHFDEIKEMLQ